jgi:hypothetical protein
LNEEVVVDAQFDELDEFNQFEKVDETEMRIGGGE